jgi:hypothetical protein
MHKKKKDIFEITIFSNLIHIQSQLTHSYLLKLPATFLAGFLKIWFDLYFQAGTLTYLSFTNTYSS